MTCQQCGAPAQIAPGQTHYTCPYCKGSYNLAPPPGAHIPQIVVIAPGSSSPARAASVAVWVGLLLPVLIVVLVFANLFRQGVFGDMGFGTSWSGKETLECDGNDQITVSDVAADLGSDTAVSASGNCTVHIKHCTITAGTGIEAAGNAHVYVEQGSIKATKLSVDASGNAHVELHGTKVTGPKMVAGNAKVVGP